MARDNAVNVAYTCKGYGSSSLPYGALKWNLSIAGPMRCPVKAEIMGSNPVGSDR